MILRDTSGMIIPIGMPILIMAMNGIGQGGDVVLPNGATVMDAIIVPLTLAMILALVGVVNMPSFLATYRKTCILRRLSVTPVRPTMLLGAQMAVSGAQALLGVALALLLGIAAFGVTLPDAPGWALLAGALALAAMYAVGTFITAVAPTINAAIALGLVAFFAMLALGGGFGGLASLPEALAAVGERMPYGAANQALASAWTGERPGTLHLAVLGIWTVLFGALAVRFFRWD